MFNLFGRNKDSSKKSSSEAETDGFVIIGSPKVSPDVAEEQRQRNQNANVGKPSCNVIVQPSKSSSAVPHQLHTSLAPAPPSMINQSPGPAWKPPAPVAEDPPSFPELLGDVPFTLAPHVLAMQTGGPGFPHFSEMLMSSRDINHNLASFSYDFTLENSVLCDH
ncbi:UBAP1-MVB12-associated (UMA)-domain containing protein 1 isoform X2 [Esox lucius]|uniref:UBAP1-MVB12-associated (UMA)-domain containing protein 1 isoform X2 n=1 Tax=Esox lucius TaxID=8010 RepID=UPI00097329B0|nr:UBAP1-MVB12-associated (UMA)-domain containing protein 1 isoform X2 [Esox lucius]